MKSRCILFILLLFCINIFSQQKITGKIIDENGIGLSSVLIKNIKTNQNSYSDSFGNFTIDANENDEVRFVKDSYYRTDRKVTKDNLSNLMNVLLIRAETLIQEVKIEKKMTGNLALDSKRFGDAKDLVKVKAGLGDYMRSPLNEPLPTNEVSKTFKGHDFSAGQVDLFGVFKVAKGLVKKATEPKITKPTYNETQNFINEVKQKINLNFLTSYGLNEEQIDHFLIYANDTRQLAKKYRKTFNIVEIESELKTAFALYNRTHKV
ncbi:hypothetical protein ABEG63_14300 [Chryseobacterium sp. C39-AII1]|uniref:hypothetical protein n=1 Tax=Chryseobacterium sp. C39-AII1 TaxID=3080332 RepID=UPI003208B477